MWALMTIFDVEGCILGPPVRVLCQNDSVRISVKSELFEGFSIDTVDQFAGSRVHDGHSASSTTLSARRANWATGHLRAGSRAGTCGELSGAVSWTSWG